MKNKAFYIGVMFFVLIICNILLVKKINSTKQKLSKEAQYIDIILHNNATHKQLMQKYYLEQLKNENTPLESIILHKDNTSYSLNEILDNKNKFVFVAPQKACSPCYDEIIMEFGYISEQIGFENFLVIVPMSKYREFMSFFKNKNYNISPYALNSEDNLPEIMNQDVPYFFILNEDLMISHIFIPQKTGPEYFIKYFDIIKYKFF